MASIIWEPKYSVAIASLDDHHKKLFELINALDSGADQAKIQATLKELINYTQYHFGKEEEILQANAYPDYGSHMKVHLEFIKKIREFTTSFHSGAGVSLVNLRSYLSDWLADHILVLDKKYAEFLSGRGIK